MTEKYKQSSVFLESEGDQWFKRNKSQIQNPAEKIHRDPVLSAIDYLSLKPARVFEIGCSNGWRLSVVKNSYGSECFGIDPSLDAISDGEKRFTGVSLAQGTAEDIPFQKSSFDMVILGFCLYLCDRQDLFTIAREVDRVLSDSGFLVIYDFSSSVPYHNPYEYDKNIASYKMDYAKMFDWNPEYSSIYSVTGLHSGLPGYAEPDSRIAVNVLKKSSANAYPGNPYANR